MKHKIIDFFKGFAIGISNLIPGYSGGTTAVIVGEYDRFVGTLGALFSHPLKALKDTWALFLGMIVGILVGIVGIVKLIGLFPVQTAFFIVGLVLASYPGMVKSINECGKFKVWDFVAFVISCTFIVVLPFLSRDASHDFSFWIPIFMVFLGALCAAAMVIPGVSGALVLMAFGYFLFLMNHLSNIITSITTFTFNGFGISIIVAASFAVGALLGLVYISKFISISLEKSPKTVYMAIFGILVASPFAIFYAIYNEADYQERIANTGPVGYVIGAIMLIIGALLVLLVPYLAKKNRDKKENTEELKEA